MKLIVLLLGLAIGFGGGVWYSINNPKEAADLNAKQQEWLKKGQEQALTKLKDVLNAKVAAAEAAPAAPAGARSFGGGTTAGGGKAEADALNSVKSVVDAQLADLKK